MTAGWPSTAAGSLQLRTTARHARLPNGGWGARCSHPSLEATAGARTRRLLDVKAASPRSLRHSAKDLKESWVATTRE